jgi:large subunit ribosomal protein L17
MACSLILSKRIRTTLAKAKALRVYVEPLITKSKNDTTHSRRTVFRQLGLNTMGKEAVKELFGTVSSKVATRPGGYTRIIKLNNRSGDNAEMCYMELVDFNDVYVKSSTTTTETTKKRSRRGTGTSTKKSDDVSSPEPSSENIEESTEE